MRNNAFEMRSKVAVIGPFHNGHHHAVDWLAGLKSQTYQNFKIYAVDDASQDFTAEMLAEAGKPLAEKFEVIALTRNVGPSAARNVAIRRALKQGARVILLLDSDCRVEPDWIARHASFHEQHPLVDIMGGAISGFATSFVGKADGFCSWFTAVPQTSPGPVKRLHLSSTNMSLKHTVFETVGYFDEYLATGEDVAFCRRAQNLDQTLYFESEIVVTHLDRNAVPDAVRHHFRWGLHSYALSLQQHGGYYGVLKSVKRKWTILCLIPVIASLSTVLILYKYSAKRPRVWLYLPWIFYLKWWNAVGVYQGFLDPQRCLRK